MPEILKRWLALFAGVAAAIALGGAHANGWIPVAIAALILLAVNEVVRPIFVLLSLPLIVVTAGLFFFVLNALLFLLVGAMVPGFQVAGFWPALWSSVVCGAVSTVLRAVLGVRSDSTQVQVRSWTQSPPPHQGPTPIEKRGSDQVIDV
jgi:putative membrane protein